VTDTPGAIEAKVPEWIELVIADCYPAEDQNRFVKGIDEINSDAKTAYGKIFLELDEARQIELLTRLEKEAVEKRVASPDFVPPALLMLKELTLIGYFTSEPGVTQALTYVHVPGHYEGCVPLEQVPKSWAIQ
ncbi:MAG: gluconate 2-dehydrogenase subunit 3 family protein, partial [Bacteroidota bacterium]|nr:gluconate 2-dehydrogenase subunit 3 family protein [Bacteroidota bacterium]